MKSCIHQVDLSYFSWPSSVVFLHVAKLRNKILKVEIWNNTLFGKIGGIRLCWTFQYMMWLLKIIRKRWVCLMVFNNSDELIMGYHEMKFVGLSDRCA